MISTPTQSTFHDLSLMALWAERRLKQARAAHHEALAAHLEALLAQIQTTKGAALDAAKGNGQ